jgi:tetratricopeptide (TPR) repeat protein
VARQLREKRPDFAAKSLCNLSKQMKSRRLFDLQLRWAQKAVEVMSTDPQAHTQLADAHLCFGRLDEALRLYDYTMQNFPHDEVAPCGRAEVLRELGRLDDALRLYEETMQRFPQNEVAHCGRAEVLRELGRLDEALRLYEETMQRFPQNEVAHCGRAEVLRELGRLDEALRLYEETMQRFPQDEVARCGRAEVLRELGRLDEALRLYEETMQRFPQSEVARCGRAIVLMELHKFDEALDLLPQSVPRIRQDWIAFHIRGMVHLRRGDIDKAAEVFRRGVRECPIVSSMKYFRGALAVAQLIRGQYGDVESTLRGVEGETADVLRLHAYGEQGQDEQARTAYERLQESQRKRVQELRDELAPVYIFAEQVALRSSQAWRDKIHRQECQLVWLTAA